MAGLRGVTLKGHHTSGFETRGVYALTMTSTDNDETFEVIDLSQYRNSSWVQRLTGDLSRQSTSKQLAIGGVSGWCAGYLFGKVGKVAAAALGTSLILLQVAQYNGYININWNNVEQSMNRAKRRFERESARQFPQYFDYMQDFMRQNMFVAGGFAGGFLLGLAS